ncbi:carbohydrate ABC transporter permease [Paenibacillus beijingensis]|uniref:Maltose/maltodextrin transport system permease protein n=1 Tax=Paenibacillus beijingensis TaxID=1126833 RepID=A0A0D5NKN7_9BACL|nr:sugar ABC transporter permease [Paenibacillus beijingensis]AJY75914.1 sugar ABC transporter permease [Paenibacillus beijingensis]
MNRHSLRATVLSILFMGFGQLYNRQWFKGLPLAVTWAAVLIGCSSNIFATLKGLVTLGVTPTHRQKVNGLYVTIQGDHSIFLMVQGLIAFFALLLIISVYVLNVRDAYINGRRLEEKETIAPPLHMIGSFRDKYFPFITLLFPFISILFLTVLPIIFSTLLAFTNYADPILPPGNLINWVGFDNFFNLVQLKSWSSTFVGVLIWTIVWAVIATFSCYFGGMFVAMLIHQPFVRFKKMWRAILIVPIAIPTLVSLLMMRNLFNNKFGPINEYLKMLGMNGLPWLTDPFWAKVTVLLVNLWIGIPVSMILISGILVTIPRDLYEAAEIDGARPRQKFRHITLPLVLFSTTPIIIMQFANNINNFNMIYLLTNGGPVNPNYQYAGDTDLLVTWLYKLTLSNQQYNLASVIGIIIFVIIASLSIFYYRRTRSYNEEDMIG